MDKNEWYRNRILWKCEKNKLIGKSCHYYSELPEDVKNAVSNRVDDEPIFVCLGDGCEWTAITTESIYSNYDDAFVKCKLDDLNGNITNIPPCENPTQEESKFKSDYLLLKEWNIKIWAPRGKEMFALWNLLRMFPLNVPAE